MEPVVEQDDNDQWWLETDDDDEEEVDPRLNGAHTGGVCTPCTNFDPRCLHCNEGGCLECADPILWSTHRSGYRTNDPEMPFDEVIRELPVTLPFGSQR